MNSDVLLLIVSFYDVIHIFLISQDFKEMYDLTADPYEMNNIINEVFPAMRRWYKMILTRMLICSGARNCDDPFDLTPYFTTLLI